MPDTMLVITAMNKMDKITALVQLGKRTDHKQNKQDNFRL